MPVEALAVVILISTIILCVTAALVTEQICKTLRFSKHIDIEIEKLKEGFIE